MYIICTTGDVFVPASSRIMLTTRHLLYMFSDQMPLGPEMLEFGEDIQLAMAILKARFRQLRTLIVSKRRAFKPFESNWIAYKSTTKTLSCGCVYSFKDAPPQKTNMEPEKKIS